jgi:Enoyl-CoA hydratase/isomerase/Outer membrane efflux protein
LHRNICTRTGVQYTLRRIETSVACHSGNGIRAKNALGTIANPTSQDVRQAEENLHAASAAVGVALANMLPQFTIDANIGSSALKLGQLFSPYTGFWDVGASLTQTLFDAGALLHKRRAADAVIVASESAQFSDVYARWGLTPVWGLSLRLPHRIGTAKASEMMLTCRNYSGTQAEAMHLANFCFPDDQFDAEVSALSADILKNSWYANQVNKRALTEIDGLSLHDAHALELFKNEGVAPDAGQRVENFLVRRKRSD